MDFIKYIDGTSGSSGNCHLLAIEELKTVVLLDIGVPFKTVFGYMKQVEFDVEHVVVCVTHEHGDHWKRTTYDQIKKKYDDVWLMFRQYPSKGQEGVRFFNKLVNKNIKLLVTQHQFSHGSTESSIYRLCIIEQTDFQPVERAMYATDIDPNNATKIAKSDLFHDMDLMMIEANYDDRHFMDFVMNPSRFVSFGYDVSGGFVRHLSKQQSEMIVAEQKPKEVMYIHKSTRFYDYEE